MKRHPLRTFGAVLLVAGFISLSAASPTSAATTSGTTGLDFWWDKYGVDAAHSEGITGRGVKVAVLEEQINPSLPVFEGQNLRISDKPVCKDHPSMTSTNPDKGTRHGTTMTALLIGNGTGSGGVRGIAPDAEVTFYGYGPDDRPCYPDSATETDMTAWGYGVKLAVDDGAKIVYTAVGMERREADAPAIAYAIARGVALVSATANPSAADLLGAPITDGGDSLNGVVAVSAIGPDGALQTSADGSPWIIPQTTVVAGGDRFPEIGTESGWDGSATATGSSNASPIVAGMLALAAQKFPESTGNQLIQAMLATTNGERHEPSRTEDGFGYGAAWLPTLLAVDPTTFPDETPLMNKSAGFPTADQIAAARTNGYVAPDRGRSFDQYADDSPTSGFDFSSLVMWAVIGIVALVLIAAVITVLIIVTQRRRARKGTSP